jgi:hypothetical protein
VKSIAIGIAAAALLAAAGDAHAIYQCRDENGTVAFQDHPCTATQKAEREIATPADKGKAESTALELTVPSIGAVRVSVPGGWRPEIGDAGGMAPPTLRLTANNDGGRVDLLMTLMPDLGNLFSKEQALDTAVVETSQQYLERSVQGKVVVHHLTSPGGIGAYASFTERVRPPKPQFANVSSGLFSANGLVCTFTLLADDLASENHRIALTLVSRGIVVPPKK